MKVSKLRAFATTLLAFAFCVSTAVPATALAATDEGAQSDGGAVYRVLDTEGGEGGAGEGQPEGADEPDTPPAPQYATVSKLTLNKTSANLKNNGKVTLKATVVLSDNSLKLKSDDEKELTWSSSNSKVAGVKAAANTLSATVWGKKTGTVTITVKAPNGVKATAKVKVKVNKKKLAKKIPVLTYHRICSDWAKKHVYKNSAGLAISKTDFRKQMRWLKNSGYKSCTMAEFQDWYTNGAFLPKKTVLITIDDGFYETYHVAYPILKKYGQKATSFVIGARVPKTTDKYNQKSAQNHYVGRDIIKKFTAEGACLEFQSHTYDMHYKTEGETPAVKVLGLSAIKEDFATMSTKFVKKCDWAPMAVAYPFGDMSSKLIKAVKAEKTIKLGFAYKVNKPVTRKSNRYKLPRFKVHGERGWGNFKKFVQTAG